MQLQSFSPRRFDPKKAGKFTGKISTHTKPEDRVFALPFRDDRHAPATSKNTRAVYVRDDKSAAFFTFRAVSRITFNSMFAHLRSGLPKTQGSRFYYLTDAVFRSDSTDAEGAANAVSIALRKAKLEKKTVFAEISLADLDLYNALLKNGFVCIRVEESASLKGGVRPLDEFKVIMLRAHDKTGQLIKSRTVNAVNQIAPKSYRQLVDGSTDAVGEYFKLEKERMGQVWEDPGTKAYLELSRRRLIDPNVTGPHLELGCGFCPDAVELVTLMQENGGRSVDFLDRDHSFFNPICDKLNAANTTRDAWNYKECNILGRNPAPKLPIGKYASIRLVNVLSNIPPEYVLLLVRRIKKMLAPGGIVVFAEADWSNTKCLRPHDHLTNQIQKLLKLTCGQHEVNSSGAVGRAMKRERFNLLSEETGVERVLRGPGDIHRFCPETRLDNAWRSFGDKGLISENDAFGISYPINILTYQKPVK